MERSEMTNTLWRVVSVPHFGNLRSAFAKSVFSKAVLAESDDDPMSSRTFLIQLDSTYQCGDRISRARSWLAARMTMEAFVD